MSTAACCTPSIIPTHRPLLQRGWQAALAALRRVQELWQRPAREHAQRLALQGLSDSTLRDIGIAERLPAQPRALGLMDHERGRWS
jgi:uncharacterized protein YjiS (DUF1127 family)